MNHALYGILLAFLLFVGMLVLLELGRRPGQRRIARDAEADLAGS